MPVEEDDVCFYFFVLLLSLFVYLVDLLVSVDLRIARHLDYRPFMDCPKQNSCHCLLSGSKLVGSCIYTGKNPFVARLALA